MFTWRRQFWRTRRPRSCDQYLYPRPQLRPRVDPGPTLPPGSSSDRLPITIDAVLCRQPKLNVPLLDLCTCATGSLVKLCPAMCGAVDVGGRRTPEPGPDVQGGQAAAQRRVSPTISIDLMSQLARCDRLQLPLLTAPLYHSYCLVYRR